MMRLRSRFRRLYLRAQRSLHEARQTPPAHGRRQNGLSRNVRWLRLPRTGADLLVLKHLTSLEANQWRRQTPSAGFGISLPLTAASFDANDGI